MGTPFLRAAAGLVIGLVSLAVSAAARAAEPVAVLPYRIDYGGWFTVSGTIKGLGPFDFIIDTGSTKTLIFANVVEGIGGVVATNDPPISVIGLTASRKFPTYRVGDIDVGGARMNELVTVIMRDWTVDGRSPQGVLGLDFLERYHLEFDASLRQVRLYDRKERYQPPSRGWRPARIERKDFGLENGYLYTATLRLNGVRVEFLVDLGATGTLVNELAAALGRNPGISVRMNGTRASRILDALEEESHARAIYFEKISLGRTNWNRAVLIVYDAPVFAELGAVDRPFGLVGTNLFEDRSFAFDFASGQIYVGPRLNP